MGRKKYPRRLKRSESFLGIHFDCHMSERCTQVGKNVTRRMVEKIIDQVKPDYIQCDCKGHRGLTSYPTRVGYAAPGFVRDQLRIWRQVTARRGVALYMHYSGVWDTEAVRRHPSWARIDENGKRDKRITSVFGPYADKLLIPQLQELIDDYGIDGVWVDGECWATERDYGKKAIAAFRQATGIRRIPKKPEDPHYRQFTEFCREGFRRYLDHYVTALHEHNPDFQIASNWAYSSHMPEPVGVNVDYISGDYSMANSVNAARLEGRCIARQGKPWDLMAWSFCEKWREGCKSTKSIAQLQQEAAIVLALGGGFQAYFRQKHDGSIHDWTMRLMAEVARFCRARQQLCHRAEAVPQIALLYSTAAYYRKSQRVFSPWGGELVPLSGVLRALLESQHAVEIVINHHLSGRMGEYPLIVIPEWDYLKPKFRRELLDYVAGGGSLLLIGPRAAAMFKGPLRVKFVGKAEEKPHWLEHDGWLCGLKTLSQRVNLGRGAKAFGKLYAENDNKGPHEVAASVARYGRGKIAATYLNLGERYVNAATSTARKFLSALVRELFPKPVVEVSGSHAVDVTVNRIGGKLAVNLVNTSGPHADPNIYVFDEVAPVGPLHVTIRTGKKPRRVTLEPAKKKLRYQYRKSEITLTLPRLEIHDIIVVE